MSRKELLPIPELTESRRSYDHNAYRNYNLRHQSRLDPRVRPPVSPIGDIVSSASNPRHWMYLFENLQISVMRIFQLAQNDRSATECKEVIFLLEKYLRSFHTLYENFHSKHRCGNVPTIGRNKILQPVIPDLNELYDKRYRSKELVGGRPERRARKREDDIEVNYGDDEYSKQKHAMILRNRKEEENLLLRRNHDQYIEKRAPREKLRHREHSEETNSTGEDYEQFEGQQAQEIINDMNEEQHRREQQQHRERVRKEHARCERSQSPKNSKMYEKLFGDSRQSKDVQREIEKFNKTMHQQPRSDELDGEGTDFSDHYKQHRAKHTVNSKKQIIENIAGHSENVFKYLEDDQEEDKDLEKYNDLKEDETLTDISEIGQNDDPFSENMTGHHKKSVEKQSHGHRSSSPRKVSIKHPEVTGCDHLIKRDDQWEMTKPKMSNIPKKKETYSMPNDDFITTDYLEPTCI